MVKPLLLCTDLDRTLLPNGPEPESPQARSWLRQRVGDQQIVMAFVTGRDRWLVESALASYRLPAPAFVIGDVGSSIYDLRAGCWSLLAAWHEKIGTDWQDYSNHDLQQLLQGIELLTLQEARKQNRYKLSYYLPLDSDQALLQKQIIQRFEEKNIQASLTWSIDEPAGVGLLDILPASASKLHALVFLVEYLRLDLADTLFAGDSGNDLPALTSEIPAVLVANATPSVRQQAKHEVAETGFIQQLYFAERGVCNMNGNYAGGIIEGISHYHPELLREFPVN